MRDRANSGTHEVSAKGGLGPVLLVAFAVAGTVALALELASRDRSHVARVVEAVSYSTRSELARRLDAQQNTLARLGRFWSRFGETPSAEWASQVDMQRDLLSGIEFLAWSDPERGIRRLATPDDFDLERSATESEWRSIQDAIDGAQGAATASMTGPIVSRGRLVYRVHVPVRGHRGPRGTLVAQFGAQETLDALLRDEAPGYAIRVSWEGRDLYVRESAVAAPDLPEAWRQEGAIRLPFGAIWQVEHEPTAALVADLSSGEAELVLAAGALISLLLGALAFEGQRARRRAQAARAAEAEVRQLNLELEDRVARRTAELEEAMVDLRAFNSFVSHDLKSPLGAILTFASLLREDAGERLGPEGLCQLAHIESAARSGLSRTEGLLGLSTVGHEGLRCESVDLTALVADVFEEVHVQADAPAVELAVRRLPRIFCDPELLRTALANLIGNALKFTRGSDGARIEVGATVCDGETVLHVRDNGPGFEAGAAGRLFQPFVRLDAERTEGHGLGLTIVERVARRHGGRVWADGRPGEGATFHLSLPSAPNGVHASYKRDASAARAV